MKRESNIETYLRQATRGLWGQKRREVREELAVHLSERTTAHRIAGLSEREAEERALRELGAPQMVSTGMAQIYTLPTVMGSSPALITLCLTVVALWPRGMAQPVQGTFYYPTQKCLSAIDEGEASSGPTDECVYFNDEFWVSTKALQSVLEPQGVMFENDVFGAGVLKVTVPGSTGFFTEFHPRESLFGIGALARGYVSFWNIVERFAMNSNAQVKIAGWDNPTIGLNNVSFSLEDSTQQVKGERFYRSYLSAVLDQGLSVNSRWGKYKSTIGLIHGDIVQMGLGTEDEIAFRDIGFAVKGNPGDAYGFVTLIDPTSVLGQGLMDSYNFDGAAFYHLYLARVAQDGTVTVRIPDGTFRLVEDVSFPNVKSGDSVLVRLAGGNPQSGGWYEVISPEAVKQLDSSAVQPLRLGAK